MICNSPFDNPVINAYKKEQKRTQIKTKTKIRWTSSLIHAVILRWKEGFILPIDSENLLDYLNGKWLIKPRFSYSTEFNSEFEGNEELGEIIQTHIGRGNTPSFEISEETVYKLMWQKRKYLRKFAEITIRKMGGQ